jgi:hypothetical protein
MPARFLQHSPSATFEDRVSAAMKQARPLIEQASAAGEPQPAVSVNIGDLDEAQLTVVRRIAAEQGITVVLVDHRPVPRPGTIPVEALDPASRQGHLSAQVSQAAGDRLASQG